MTAFRPAFLRSSCSGSAAQFKNVTTSLAIWEVVAGVPGTNTVSNAYYESCIYALTVVILDEAVEQNTSHRNGVAREVGVVVHALTNLEASRGIPVASEERKDVVLFQRRMLASKLSTAGKHCTTYRTTVTSLHDQTQVRRKSTLVARTRGFFIRVGRGEIVGELARASEHLTLVVRAVLILDLLGHSLHLVNGMGDTNKIAPSNAVQRMARSAHLAVNLVPSPDAGSPHETRQEVT